MLGALDAAVRGLRKRPDISETLATSAGSRSNLECGEMIGPIPTRVKPADNGEPDCAGCLDCRSPARILFVTGRSLFGAGLAPPPKRPAEHPHLRVSTPVAESMVRRRPWRSEQCRDCRSRLIRRHASAGADAGLLQRPPLPSCRVQSAFLRLHPGQWNEGPTVQHALTVVVSRWVMKSQEVTRNDDTPLSHATRASKAASGHPATADGSRQRIGSDQTVFRDRDYVRPSSAFRQFHLRRTQCLKM